MQRHACSRLVLSAVLLFALTLVLSQVANTGFSLYFTPSLGGATGAFPTAGLTIDQAGKLYGTSPKWWPYRWQLPCHRVRNGPPAVKHRSVDDALHFPEEAMMGLFPWPE